MREIFVHRVRPFDRLWANGWSFQPQLLTVIIATLVLSCGRSPLTAVVAQAPNAVIDPAQVSVLIGEPVVLNGGGSYDPLKERLTFDWQILAAPSGSRAKLDSPSTSQVRLVPDEIGELVVQLKVVAGDRLSDPVTATITVTDPARNRAPVARAPASVMASLGSKVLLDGTLSSDPDGDALTYRWRALSAPPATPVVVDNATSAVASFHAAGPGDYTFELTVTDPGGLSGSARSAVTVGGGPVIVVDAGVPPVVVVDAGVYLKPLNPSEVYLAGTLSEGACYLDALAHWSDPNLASAGFDCYFDSQRAVIRPTDGRLIYTNVFEDVVRAYECDNCAFTKASMGMYPRNVLNNDPIITTPCPGKEPKVSSFTVSADGELLYQCQYARPGRWCTSRCSTSWSRRGPTAGCSPVRG